MEYVVFRTSGRQYRAKVGDIFTVDKISGNPLTSIPLSEVLLWVSNGQIKIGKPTIPGAKIKAKILEHMMGDKIRVSKFKAKVRYRKVIGFRPRLTSLLIEKVEIPNASEGKLKSPIRKQKELKK